MPIKKREPVRSVLEARKRWRRPAIAYKILAAAALIALAIQTGMLLLALFEPPLPYRIARDGRFAAGSDEFLRTLAALSEGTLHRNNTVEVLTNGENFYAAELEAIRGAKQFIHMERYLLSWGRVAEQLLKAATERARDGVKVRIVFDAIGGRVSDGTFRPLRDVGGRVGWYHPVRWYTWPRVNNRTHRELLVVDGRVAIIGGAGIADFWRYGDTGQPQWRDTMARIQGPAVNGIQAVFAENWLESTGEMLFNPDYFPVIEGNGPTTALVVSSSPSTGRSTQARVLVQALIAAARSYVHITSPYFIPDQSLSDELARAAKERHVEVGIVVPNEHTDHRSTRRASRGLYGPLLEAGIRIYEYQPSMIHVKSLVVDGAWVVLGSTNMDSRSFALNDEISVAMRDPAVARRVDQEFERDVSRSRRITLEDWQRRGARERIEEWIAGLYQRQQ